MRGDGEPGKHHATLECPGSKMVNRQQRSPARVMHDDKYKDAFRAW